MAMAPYPGYMSSSRWEEQDYYEKPMITNVTVQKSSAMGENNKMKILANYMARRLLNTGEDMGKVEKCRVVDLNAQK